MTELQSEAEVEASPASLSADIRAFIRGGT
jgi:hypothetical protein